MIFIQFDKWAANEAIGKSKPLDKSKELKAYIVVFIRPDWSRCGLQLTTGQLSNDVHTTT